MIKTDSSITVNKNNWIISEYPYGVEKNQELYADTNRLTSTFVDKLWILESDNKSEIRNLMISNINLEKDVCSFKTNDEKSINLEILNGGGIQIKSFKI